MHAVVGNDPRTVCVTLPKDDVHGNPEGFGAQVTKLSMELVGVSGSSSAVECTNTIDQAHKASMNQLTKMMAHMRQDSDASKRFCGGSGSAARTAAASSLDVCGLQAGLLATSTDMATK